MSSKIAVRAPSIWRVLAFCVDWLVIAVWGGLLFGAVMLATGGSTPQPGDPWIAEAVGFVTMTVPVTLYFSVLESSGWRASLGKRAVGLVVCGEGGDRLGFGRSLLRNALKFVPWEFGHLVAQQAAFAGEAGFPPWVWGPAVIAMVGPLWWFATLISTGRTPYDRWSGAFVEKATAGLDPAQSS